MIMPCMNSTSACDNGGSVAFVEDDSVLLGLPGAPGCTTTGGVADSLCCARVGAQRKAVAALAARSIPHSTPAPLAALHFFPRRKLYISPSASQLNIFNALTLKGSGETQRRRNAVSTFKIPGIFVESGQAGAIQAATVTAKQNITMLRLSPSGSIVFSRQSEPIRQFGATRGWLLGMDSCISISNEDSGTSNGNRDLESKKTHERPCEHRQPMVE